MAITVKKKSFKESWRKFLVSLKRRPHNIELVLLLITYMVFSFNLSKVSHTTSMINLKPMGLVSFAVMLFSLLGIVTFLNAFPVRQKPKIPMVVLYYVIHAILIACDLIYILKIEEGVTKVPAFLENPDNYFIVETELMLVIHIALLAVSVLFVILLPLISKLLNKINTSIEVEESASVKEIDISNE